MALSGQGLGPWTSAQTKLQYPDAGGTEEDPWVLAQLCRIKNKGSGNLRKHPRPQSSGQEQEILGRDSRDLCHHLPLP